MTARRRWLAHTDNLGNDGNGRTTQLNCIIGPKRPSDKAQKHNDVEMWDKWDHHQKYASIHEDDAQNYFPQTKKKWQVGDNWMMKPKIEFKKTDEQKRENTKKNIWKQFKRVLKKQRNKWRTPRSPTETEVRPTPQEDSI